MNWASFLGCASSIAAWTEKHPGLGGWFGAVGAILAVVMTWFIARQEYLRVKREADARRRSEIALFIDVVSRFAILVRFYLESLEAGGLGISNFANNHLNDPEVHGMTDLAHVPVNQWPSVEAYIHFKTYWTCALDIMGMSSGPKRGTDRSRVIEQKAEHEAKLQKLEQALREARP